MCGGIILLLQVLAGVVCVKVALGTTFHFTSNSDFFELPKFVQKRLNSYSAA